MVLHRHIIQFVLLLGFVAALTATAGDISSTLQVTPQIKSVGANTLHTVRWMTISPINRRGVIAVLYPDNFDLSQLTMATTYDYTTMNGVLKVDSVRTVSYKGKTYKKVIITRKDGGTNENGQGNVGVQLAVIGNAANTGFYRLRLETYLQDANPFTAVPSDTGSTTFQITESITNFNLSSANVEPRAGEGFTVNVTNARDAEGKLADGIINIAFQTGSIADHTAPDGATKPVLTSIWVQDGSGSATQTCYRVEKVRLTGTVSGGTATATTGDINVRSGNLGSLTISDPPLTTTAGLDFGVGNDITVTAFDNWKNRKTDLSGFLYFEGSDPRALFDYNISSPFYFVGTESGVKTFSGEAFEFRTAGLQTFTAVMGSIRQTSRNIQVLSGAIKSFNFEVVNTQTAGTPFELKVINAVDDFNNLANATVQPNFVSGTHNAPDGTQPLFSKITVQNGSGSAFQTLVLAESVQLVGQATASVSAITNSFNVLPTSLSNFKLTGQPSSVVSGAFFSNSITVTAYDAFENKKTNFSSTVTFSSTDTDSRVVLPAPTSLISGSYTFPGTNFKLLTIGNQKINATFGSISGSTTDIKVTGPNTIRILRVFAVDSTVSRGQTQRIVTMQVQNNGSDPFENYTATLNFRQGALSVNGDYVSAAKTGTAIGAAQTINLDFPVDVKTTATLGSIILDGQINGFYKGVTAQSNNSELTDTWIVQQQANVQAQTLTVTPDTVSRGSGGIELKLRLANNIGVNNSADALLNTVSFRFLNEQSTDVTSSFQVTADPLNPVRVAGNATADLKFFLTSSTNAPLGRIALSTQVEFQDANIQQNRVAGSGTLATLVSVDAPSLNITSITPVDQPTATLGQDKDFVVEMKVHNISTSAVNISLDPQKTYIRFIKSGREYISPDDVQWPTALRNGGTSIPAGSEGYIDFTVRQINAQVPTGNFTILGRVESSDGYFTTSDLSGAYGAIEIQSADDVVITKSYPSRPTVTVNDDTRPWTIGVVLINRGGSDVQINAGTSSVVFTNSIGQTVSGFNVGTPYLSKGDALLSGSEVDTLFFPVAKTGAPKGTVTLNPRISYTVVNTSQTKLIEAANFNRTSSILLQDPAILAIESVHTAINTLSVGRAVSWDIYVVVENRGEAALDLDIADVDSTWIRFTLNGQPATGYSVQKPSVLSGSNSTLLAGGDVDSLRYRISANPTAAGTVDAKAAVKAVELNRNMVTYDATNTDHFATIVVETSADVVYTSGTLAPLQVNPGKMVEFQLTVRNNGQADVVLTSETTTFSLSDGSQTFSAELDGNYGTVVPGNGSLRLHFQQTYLSTGFALGFFEPVVQLSGSENSAPYQKELRLTGENVKVGQPGNISLDSLSPNVGEVTLGQTAPWFVNIGVTNNSGQTLKLKTTELVFSSGTLNVTSQFALQIAAAFENGSDLLPTGNSGTVRATIASVSEGVPTGDVLLSARVVLVDPQDSGALFEEQINNAAKVTVQTRAVLDVTALTSAQSSVTRGQTEPWIVTTKLENTGQSALRLITDPALTFLSFSKGDANFTVQPPTAFVGSSTVELKGNKKDSLYFRVIQVSAAPSMVGETTINANIGMQEINTGRILTDISPQVLRVQVQDSSKVRIDKLIAVIESPGTVNAGQEFYLRALLTNVGSNSADHVKNARVKISSTNTKFSFVAGDTMSVQDLAPNESKWTLPGIRIHAPSEAGEQGLFNGEIIQATARNTNAAAKIVTPTVPGNASVAVRTQNPPQYRMVAVEVDQEDITSSSTLPWTIFATVANDGEGIIELLEPVASNIKILAEGGNEETDYLIEAQPLTAEQKQLSNGETAKLAFIVRETGKGAGNKTVRADIYGKDLNNTAGGPLVVSGTAPIFVTSSSIVRLMTTTMDAAVNNVSEDGIGHVNVGQEFNVKVQVRNEGGRYLETIRVALTALSSQVLTPEIQINRLAIAGTAEATFRVKAAAGENLVGETLTATILEAKGFDGSQAVIKDAEDPITIIKIYQPAKLRIIETVNLAPNPQGQVSFGQDFKIAVKVKNEGSETAVNGHISLTPSAPNQVVIDQASLPITQEITGNAVAEVQFSVQAGATPADVILTSAVTSATGKNSKAALEILNPGDNNKARVVQQPGADLEIVDVDASVETINAGDRLSPWNILVAVKNSGGADLQFVSIADTNITFSVGGILDKDYKVLPPDGLENSDNFILQAGKTDTLVYTVRRNGELAGEAQFTVYLQAFDKNSTGELKLSAVDRGNIFVANNAVVQIRETVAVANELDENSFALVNREQVFEVQVRIQTGQFGGVDSVIVKLESNGNSLTTAVYDTIQTIESDNLAVSAFTVTADDSWDVQEREKSEIFTATIIQAFAKGDTTRITPREPARGADQAKIRIQVPAQLSYRLQLGDYGGSTVEAGKEFIVTAKMYNRGSAAIGVGKLQAIPPNGYFIEREPDNFIDSAVEKPFSFDVGKDSMDIRFTFKAPEFPSGPDVIRAVLTVIPIDKNSGVAVQLGDISTDLTVTADNAPSLAIESFVISSPQGAVDGTISTEQIFELKAVVKSRQSIPNRKATLELPVVPVDPGYEFKTQQVLNITSETQELVWSLQAPLYGVPNSHTFTLSVTGGVNSQVEFTDERSLEIVRVQRRTTLGLEPIEIQPEGVIKEGEAYFTFAQEAQVNTRIRNFGEAGYSGEGNVTLDLSQSGGIILNNGDVPTKPFTNDELITWNIKAPATIDQTARIMRVRISSVPQDNNSNVPARVSTVERSIITHVTRGGSIVVEAPKLRTIFGQDISVVSTEQQFSVSAKINTFGVKDENIRTTLFITSSEFKILDPVRFLPYNGENQLQTWNVIAPSSRLETTAKLYVRVEAIDSQSEKAVTGESSQVDIPLVERTLFTIEPYISFPAGLQGSEKLSTEQTFSLTAKINHSGAGFVETDSFRLRLSEPVGFQFAEGQKTTLSIYAGDYVSTAQYPTWQLKAPAKSNENMARFSIFIEALPRDINSMLPSKTDKDEVIFPVRVVEKARVNLRVFVNDELGNDSTSVRPGNIFKLTSWLQNDGEAQILGSYQIDLKMPSAFELVEMDTTLQTVENDTAFWSIRAPRTVTTLPDTFVVRLLQLPEDEFARTTVALSNPDSSASAFIWVETGKVIVKSYPVRKQTGVVRGSQNVPMLGIALQNKEISSTSKSYLTGLHLSFRDKMGKLISPRAMVNRISALNDQNDAQVFVESMALSDTGTVFLNFKNAILDTLIGNETDSIKIMVDIKDGTEGGDFRVTLDSTSAIQIVDQYALPLSLVDSTGTAFSYLGFTSPMAVLIQEALTNSFYNYPNPFGRISTPSTSFLYYLKENSDVQINIYTLTGDLVRSWDIKQGEHPDLTSAGLHQGELSWDGSNGLGQPVLNGVYLAYIRTGYGEQAVIKIAVVR